MKLTQLPLLLLLYSTSHAAQDQSSSFGWLESLSVDFTQVGEIKVLYNKDTSNVINTKVTYDGYSVVHVIETKIKADSSSKYLIEYDEGLSVDPVFVVYEKTNQGLKEIRRFGGTEIVVPGNGNIYISGHTNNMFNQRRKFTLTYEGFVEVSQPYLYVGISEKTRKPITLYASQKMKTEVAKLPKGSDIEVLINDGVYYLVKTSYGLLGWYDASNHCPLGCNLDNPIPGIFNNGD